jgi:hypothetical protein
VTTERIVLGVVTVSRKTPRDGKLEIPQAVVDRLTSLGQPFAVAGTSGRAAGSVESMECHCAKAEGAGHMHHFLVSQVLRDLKPDSRVSLKLEPGGRTLSVTLAARGPDAS